MVSEKKFIKKIHKDLNKILKNFLFLHHAFDYRKKNYSKHQNNLFILQNVYNYGNCKHLAMITSDYLKRRKIKHEHCLTSGFNILNYSHILIKIVYKNKEIYIDPFWIIFSQNKKYKKSSIDLIRVIGKNLYYVNKALNIGKEINRLKDFLNVQKFSSAMYFSDKKIDIIRINYFNKPRCMKTNHNFYQKKLSSKKIIVDGIIKENLNITNYKNCIHNRKLTFKNLNKKIFTLNDLYAPIIGLNIKFENGNKIKFKLNKEKYFLNKKKEFKLIFNKNKKIELLDNLKINSNTKIKKVEVTFLSYKPLFIKKYF